jgi:hypothetical protein
MNDQEMAYARMKNRGSSNRWLEALLFTRG